MPFSFIKGFQEQKVTFMYIIWIQVIVTLKTLGGVEFISIPEDCMWFYVYPSPPPTVSLVFNTNSKIKLFGAL